MLKRLSALLLLSLTSLFGANVASFKYGLTSLGAGSDFDQNSFVFGLKLDNGQAISPRVELGYISIDKKGESVDGLLQFNIDGVYDYISNYELTPYLFAGGGYEHVFNSRKNFDSQFFIDGGIGAYYPITKDLNIFGEFRGIYLLTGEGQDGETALFVGLSMPLGATYSAPVDSDGDGVADYNDECPRTPLGARVDARGCPITVQVEMDSDGDSIPDRIDNCPNTPPNVGVDASGCPVITKRDVKVLEEKIKPKRVVKKRRSLDSDGDGVNDSEDECPNTPKGFSVNEIGCPVKKNLQIRFEVNSATVPIDQQWKIREFAAFLKKYPNAKVDIVGYTDSSGNPDKNLYLSQRRAQSVKELLISYGIKASRIKAIGKGDLNPIASNDTPEGREQNRRIEAVIH